MDSVVEQTEGRAGTSVTAAVQGQGTREGLQGLSVAQVGAWLSSIGLNEYCATFHAQAVDGETLLDSGFSL